MTDVIRHREPSHQPVNVQLISEAVVAAYIRDIAGRHRHRGLASQRALQELRRPVHRLADQRRAA
jgi:hypothetical protein